MIKSIKTHDLLSSTHGFFGRQGGVSKGVYDSLNVGQRSEDNVDDIAENRRRVAEALGADHLVSLGQIHSDIVEIITEPPESLLEADGLVTKTKGIALSALSADCGPILFEDVENGVIGACHAGWRGALGGIIESTVAAMCETGAETANIRAVLGPCISQPNYEVGEAFRAEFMEIDDSYAQFFESSAKDIPHFDLPAFILSRLKATGIKHCAWTGDCTYGDEEAYFSYRRNTHQGLTGYGRNISAIIRK
jgi:YfiH family protein